MTAFSADNNENFIKMTFPSLWFGKCIWCCGFSQWLHPFLMDYYCMKYGLWWMRPMLITVGWVQIASILDGLLLYEVWAMMDEANGDHSWLEFRLHPFLMDYYCMKYGLWWMKPMVITVGWSSDCIHSWWITIVWSMGYDGGGQCWSQLAGFRLHPFLMDYYCMKYGLWWMKPMVITVGWSSDCIHSWWITIVWSMGYDGWSRWWSQLAGVQIASIHGGLLLYEVWAMMEEANVDHSWLGSDCIHSWWITIVWSMGYDGWGQCWSQLAGVQIASIHGGLLLYEVWAMMDEANVDHSWLGSDCIHSWWITIVWSMGYDGWGQWWSQLAGVQIASILDGLLLYEVWAMMDEANVDHSWLEFRLHPFMVDYYCMKYGLWWMRPMVITVGWVQIASILDGLLLYEVWAMMDEANVDHSWLEFRLHPFMVDYYCMKYGLWWMRPMLITVGWVQIAFILDGLLLYEVWAMMDEANGDHSWLEFRLHPFLMDYYCMKYGLWWMRPMLITVGWSSDCIHSWWITIVWSMGYDGWGQWWSQLAGFRLHPLLMDYYCMKYGLWWMRPMLITVGWSSDCIHSWWITIVWSMGYDGWGQWWSQLAGVQLSLIDISKAKTCQEYRLPIDESVSYCGHILMV